MYLCILRQKNKNMKELHFVGIALWSLNIHFWSKSLHNSNDALSWKHPHPSLNMPRGLAVKHTNKINCYNRQSLNWSDKEEFSGHYLIVHGPNDVGAFKYILYFTNGMFLLFGKCYDFAWCSWIPMQHYKHA